MMDPSIESPPRLEERPPAEIHGFPAWIKASAIVVGLLVVFSLFRIGEVVRDAVSVERARRDQSEGRSQDAVAKLKPIVSRYPDSIDFTLDLAEAEVTAGDSAGAVETLNKLVGREISEAQNLRANEVATRANAGGGNN